MKKDDKKATSSFSDFRQKRTSMAAKKAEKVPKDAAQKKMDVVQEIKYVSAANMVKSYNENEKKEVSYKKAFYLISVGFAKEEHFKLAKKFMQDNKDAIIDKMPTAQAIYDDSAGLENDALGYYFHKAFEALYPKEAKAAMKPASPATAAAASTTPTVSVAAPSAPEPEKEAAAEASSKYDLRKISDTKTEVFNKGGDKLCTIEKHESETTYKPESDKLEAYEAIAERIEAEYPKAEIKVEGGTEEQRLEIIQALKEKNPDIKFDQKTQDFLDEHQPTSPKP